MTDLLIPEMKLEVFYWMYAKSDSSALPTVVTYTCAFYESWINSGTNKEFMTVEYRPLTNELFVTVDPISTVDLRVIDALEKHFSASFMLRDGIVLSAEYVADADNEDCRLHKDERFGQAIYGSDLEELYDNR